MSYKGFKIFNIDIKAKKSAPPESITRRLFSTSIVRNRKTQNSPGRQKIITAFGSKYQRGNRFRIS
ncbi:hypothetical protein LEP1GSC108_2315 [Leptospira weilii str. UI 13098]|uniref:Uncharacterized protein n=1 Tax=Leptospira weilii str. UI 13098 TaxID=1088542 RepID=M6Q5K9_9LEPT|nr:hypothetical protein LEP1GSC108_2315 [Leptospira weilii str. UI 13098]